jgi:hypothetical protein
MDRHALQTWYDSGPMHFGVGAAIAQGLKVVAVETGKVAKGGIIAGGIIARDTLEGTADAVKNTGLGTAKLAKAATTAGVHTALSAITGVGKGIKLARKDTLCDKRMDDLLVGYDKMGYEGKIRTMNNACRGAADIQCDKFEKVLDIVSVGDSKRENKAKAALEKSFVNRACQAQKQKSLKSLATEVQEAVDELNEANGNSSGSSSPSSSRSSSPGSSRSSSPGSSRSNSPKKTSSTKSTSKSSGGGRRK